MTKLPKVKSMKDMSVTFEADGSELNATDFFDLIAIKVNGRELSPSEVTAGVKAMEYRFSKIKQDKAIRELIRSGELNILVSENETEELEKI